LSAEGRKCLFFKHNLIAVEHVRETTPIANRSLQVDHRLTTSRDRIGHLVHAIAIVGNRMSSIVEESSKNRIRIGLLFGGESPEHEVSIATARSIADVIDRNRFDLQPIGVAKNGAWLVKGDPFERLTNGETPARGAFPYLPLEAGGENATLPDVFFIAIHGAGGEDGRIQSYLELLRMPYTGAGVLALAAGMDKWMARQIWQSVGLTTVPFLGVTEGRWRNHPGEVLEEARSLGAQLFVKPANLGSSIGVVKVKSEGELAPAIEQAFRFDRRVLIDTAIDAREIELGVLGGDEVDSMLVSAPGEVIVADEYYTFHDKYVGGKSTTRVPADLSPSQIDDLKRAAGLAFRSLDGYGMGRVDFFLCRKTGALYLNEINLCPGFTSISMYPKLMQTCGVSYVDLISRLISLGLERYALESSKTKNFSSGSNWFAAP
jgi:D-alanine-D-alanine ligase